MAPKRAGEHVQRHRAAEVGRVVPVIEGEVGQRLAGAGAGRVVRADDRAIAALAARQKGNVKRAQLLALGFTPGAIDRRIACGRWQGNAVAVDRDLRKNAHLRSKGFEVLRYSYGQITGDRDAVIAEVAGALAAR